MSEPLPKEYRDHIDAIKTVQPGVRTLTETIMLQAVSDAEQLEKSLTQIIEIHDLGQLSARMDRLELLCAQLAPIEAGEPETYIDRINEELSQLHDRYMKLGGFLNTGPLDELKVKELALLRRQHGVMGEYIDILNERTDIAG